MNIQWMRLMLITLLYATHIISAETIKPGFSKETWHPKLSRNYLNNDGKFELVDDRKAVYQTSLIQIQNKFLGANTPKLQCGCRFVKDTITSEVVPQKEINTQQETNTDTEPELEPVVSIENNQQRITHQSNQHDIVKTLSKQLEENNVLMNKLSNYLGNGQQNNNANKQMIIHPNQPMQNMIPMQSYPMQPMQPMQVMQPMQPIQPIIALQQPSLLQSTPVTYFTQNVPQAMNSYPFYPTMQLSNPL